MQAVAENARLALGGAIDLVDQVVTGKVINTCTEFCCGFSFYLYRLICLCIISVCVCAYVVCVCWGGAGRTGGGGGGMDVCICLELCTGIENKQC